LPPPIKGAAAADRGADNPVRLLPLFLAAQQSRSLSRFGGKATFVTVQDYVSKFRGEGVGPDLVGLAVADHVSLPDGRAGRVDGGDPLADLSPRLTSRIELAVVEYVGWFNHSRLPKVA